MGKGCDHSTANRYIGAALARDGYDGVIRYACAGRADVNITPAEVRDLHAHGIAIGIVNEHESTYLTGGYNTGHQRALEARDICRACGLPDGVVYFAGDDRSLETPRNMQLIGDALRGAGDAIGRENVGYYGAYSVIDYLVRRYPWIHYYWQVSTWSTRGIHSHVNIVQFPHGVHYDRVGGVEVDPDEFITENWGQRGYTPPLPPMPKGVKIVSIATNGQGYPNTELFVEAQPSGPGHAGEVFHIKNDKETKSQWWEKNGKPNWLSLGVPGK